MQKGRPNIIFISQHIHCSAVTNALVIYSAPIITTANLLAVFNNDLPDRLGNDDVQEDLIARASMRRQTLVGMDSTQASPDCNLNKNSYETCIDGATASKSEEGSVEIFTNDPIPLEISSKKPAKKRGRPKKGQLVRKPTILPKYNTQNKISVSEAAATTVVAVNSDFIVDGPRLATLGMSTLGSWALECDPILPKHDSLPVSQ